MQRLSNQLEFDPESGEIRGPAGMRVLEPQATAVLSLLAGTPEAILSREQLLSQAWGSRIVADSTLTAVISQVRGVLRDLQVTDVRIETLSKRGYRLRREAAAGMKPKRDRRRHVFPGLAGVLLVGIFIWLASGAWSTSVKSVNGVRLDFAIVLPNGQLIEPKIWLHEGTTGEIIQEGDHPLHLKVFPTVTDDGLLDLTFEASSMSHWMTVEQVIALGSQSQLQLRADDGRGRYDIRFVAALDEPPLRRSSVSR